MNEWTTRDTRAIAAAYDGFNGEGGEVKVFAVFVSRGSCNAKCNACLARAGFVRTPVEAQEHCTDVHRPIPILCAATLQEVETRV